MRRLFAAAASAALLVSGMVVPITPAVADPVGSCSPSAGVLVVVDLRPFGGSLTRGCDATPTDGYDALHEAGFTTEGTQHDGPGFVCRINGRPTTAQQSCVRTPPASAYWSYWTANAGQKSWSYSTRGAMSAQRDDGSVDAWVFGGTDVGGTNGQPCFSPVDARAGRATSCPTKAQPVPARSTAKAAPKQTSRTRSATAATTAGAPKPAPSTAGTATPKATGSRAVSTAPGTTTAAASSTAAASAVPTIVDASQAAADRNDSGGGSATPVVLGLVLALVLGAGAWFTVRRRRAEPEL